MTGPLMPDPEAIITAFLQTALDGLANVYDSQPRNTASAWVRVTLIDAASIDTVSDFLSGALIQLDCYAGTGSHPHREASLIARTARAALRDIVTVDHDGAVVTGARITGHTRVPDTGFEPARERIVLTAEVYLHAAATQPIV